MATADSVKVKIQNLISKANETTGKSDTDLTSGVDSLIEGFGQGDGNLEALSVVENGNYLPSEGYDGFSEVQVDVQPDLQAKSVTENGTVYPDPGYDGLSEVTVNVPATVPEGYVKPEGTKEITSNGDYDVTEYESVSVNVPEQEPLLQEKTVTENGEVTADEGYDGLSKVTVNVESSGGGGSAVNGTLKQYIVDDGAVVNAGDFVSLVPRYGSGEFVSAVKYIGSCSISAQKKIVMYHDTNLSAVMAQIVSVDEEVVFSTPVEICKTSTETSVDYVYVIALTPNRLVATHYRTMRELILDGDTITFGAELESDYPIDDITQLNENLFAISYGYRGSDSKSAYVKVGTYKISDGEFVSVATKTIRSVTSNSSANYYYSNSSLDKLNDSYLIATGCIRKSSTDVAFGATVYAFTDEGLTSICSYTETMDYDSGETEQFMRVRRLTDTSAMFTCRIGDYCYAYYFTHNDASLGCIKQQLDSSVNTSEIIGIGENKALLVHNGTSFSILTVDTTSSAITLGSTVTTNYATFYGKTGLEPLGENSVLAFVNKGAGGFVTINIENDVITLVEDTYTERGTFVKPATSYFNDVGVAATSGSAGATVSVYVVG